MTGQVSDVTLVKNMFSTLISCPGQAEQVKERNYGLTIKQTHQGGTKSIAMEIPLLIV